MTMPKASGSRLGGPAIGSKRKDTSDPISAVPRQWNGKHFLQIGKAGKPASAYIYRAMEWRDPQFIALDGKRLAPEKSPMPPLEHEEGHKCQAIVEPIFDD